MKEKLPEDSQYFLFGSRAKGINSKFSDIDIGVTSVRELDNKIIEIKELIEESFVPYDIDIIDFKNVSKKFKDEALKNDYPLELKIKQYGKAPKGFSDLVGVDLIDLKQKVDSKIIDGVLNGQAQKFEYTTELC